MATYEEIFNTQIEKFVALKKEKDARINTLKSSGLMYKELACEKRQLIEAFSEKAGELRSNPNYKQAQRLRSLYLGAKKAYESEEQNKEENELQTDFMKVCENLRSYAISKEREGESLTYRMLIEGKSTDEIDKTFYHKGQDVLTYFKEFCSGWASNIYEEKERNNNILIQQMGLQEIINKIYRKCSIFSEKCRNDKIGGLQYFNSIINLFKNIEGTIEQSKDLCFDEEEGVYGDKLFPEN